jgi:hypothetical protein
MIVASPIRLQFVLGDDLASWTIAWFSQGHFSHVDAIVDFGDGPRLLGARNDHVLGIEPGVRLRPPGYADFSRRVVFELDATRPQMRRWSEFVIDQLRKPYDSAAIWGFVFDRNWRHEGQWICSELEARALEYAEIIKPLYLPANKVTPVALAQIISVVGARVVVDEKKKSRPRYFEAGPSLGRISARWAQLAGAVTSGCCASAA